jgi:formate C-acetyltransferase
MHGRDVNGAVAALKSVSKLPYDYAEDGISYTFSIIPDTLGKNDDEKVANLVALLDGYFLDNGHHLNVNVLVRETLLDAMEHPENYGGLVVRVSGFSAYFTTLAKDVQEDILHRTEHSEIK